MWKTIWNAEGSKEPLDQYIIRKRSEAVYRLPKVRANAEEKAVVRARKKQEEKGENLDCCLFEKRSLGEKVININYWNKNVAISQNRSTNNQGNNDAQSKPEEITKYLKPSSTTREFSFSFFRKKNPLLQKLLYLKM